MTPAEYPGVSSPGSSLPLLKTNEDYLTVYSDQDFRVFPAIVEKGKKGKKGKKKPAIKNWQGTASPNLDLLLESYSLFGGKFRNNEIGALTGITFFVADDDGEGIENLMPPTPHYNSQKEGRSHYLLKVPEGMEIRNIPKEKLGMEVDIKGLGGLVILPSEFNNREWVIRPDEMEIANCPEWLLEKIRDYQDTKNTPTTKSDGSKTYSYFTEPIPEKKRNDTLFYGRALYLAYRSFSFDEILGDLRFLNINACEEPLDDKELQSISRSAISYVDKEKSEKIRAMRYGVTSRIWGGRRGKNIRSILIALLTEHIDRYSFPIEGLEVSVSHMRLAEKVGLSLKALKGNLRFMMKEGLLIKGSDPSGKIPGTLILTDECVSTPIDNLISGNNSLTKKEGMPIGVLTHSPLFLLEMNSQRVRNLGKPASMVLGLLMERPHTRKEITELLGYYSRNGATRVLQKLKHEKKLINSDGKGVYFLAEGFFDLLKEEIRANNEDIKVLREKHQVQREDYHLRLEAWDLAVEDFHREILPTAKETGGAYLFWVTYNMISVIKNLAYLRYVELKAREWGEKGICYDDGEPDEATEGDEPGPDAAATPVRPQALRNQEPTKAQAQDREPAVL